MTIQARLAAASRAAALHFGGSLVVAALAAALVFGLWFPYPYREVAGGRELFLLIVAVDVVCGPLLTLVLYNPAKPQSELWRDLGLVMLIQLAALGYGLHVVLQARPVYLVQEVDRFKVIALPELDAEEVAKLPRSLQPRWIGGPRVIAIRSPKNIEEKNKVMLDAAQGGRDYAERPDFYLPYEGEAALKSLQRAKPLSVFLQKQPTQEAAARALLDEKRLDINQLHYLPVVGRQDWVAVLDAQGQIQGFLKGDGF